MHKYTSFLSSRDKTPTVSYLRDTQTGPYLALHFFSFTFILAVNINFTQKIQREINMPKHMEKFDFACWYETK